MNIKMSIKDLQEVLRDLKKDGKIFDNLTGEILIRTVSHNKVQFGRTSPNGLFMERDAVIAEGGAIAVMLRDVDHITKRKYAKGTECTLTSTDEVVGNESEILSITIRNETTCHLTYDPLRLIQWYNERLFAVDLLFQMNAQDMREMLEKVIHCVDPRDVRRALTGILFTVNADHLLMAGTNGIKLSEVVRPHISEITDMGKKRIVRLSTAKLLKGLLKKSYKGVVRIGMSDNRVSFETDRFLIVGRLITGEEYPEYDTLFNYRNQVNSLRLPTAKLVDMSQSIAPIADPGDNNRMTIFVDDNNVMFRNDRGSINCPSDEGEINGLIDIDVNANFMLALAKNIDGDTVEIDHLTGNNYITVNSDMEGERSLLTSIRRRRIE